MDPRDSLPARRRSPGWVRALESGQLHGLALRLRGEMWESGISSRQEWLFDACVSELEYRHRRALRNGSRHVCTCELCIPIWEPYSGPEGVEEPF